MLFANNRGGGIVSIMVCSGGIQGGGYWGDLHTGKLTGKVAYKVVEAEGAGRLRA